MKKFMTKFYIAVGYIFLCLFLPVQAKTPEGVMYDAQIVRVNDGDTVVIAAPFLPKPLKPELAVRIYGVDTPEKVVRARNLCFYLLCRRKFGNTTLVNLAAV